MKMDSIKLKNLLIEKLSRPDWNINYNRKQDELRVEWQESKKGITVSLPGIIAKWEQVKDKAIDEVVFHVEEALKVMGEDQDLIGKEKHIFPVIRSTSFPVKSNEDIDLIYDDHTAETRVYYALDLGKTYRLIDQDLLEKEDWTIERIREVARFNLRSLDTPLKTDEVAGNTFYFINTNDGYDGSRILNEALLEKVAAEISGEMAVAVPHQDVLIFADIKNETGYDILAQMTMSFFADGRIPITSLPFIYEDKKLEPVFILAKNKPKS